MFGAILATSSAFVLQTGRQPSELVQSGLLAYELVGAALGVPLILTLVYLALPVADGRVAVQVVNQTFEVAGLLCIIYGLRT